MAEFESQSIMATVSIVYFYSLAAFHEQWPPSKASWDFAPDSNT